MIASRPALPDRAHLGAAARAARRPGRRRRPRGRSSRRAVAALAPGSEEIGGLLLGQRVQERLRHASIKSPLSYVVQPLRRVDTCLARRGDHRRGSHAALAVRLTGLSAAAIVGFVGEFVGFGRAAELAQPVGERGRSVVMGHHSDRCIATGRTRRINCGWIGATAPEPHELTAHRRGQLVLIDAVSRRPRGPRRDGASTSAPQPWHVRRPCGPRARPCAAPPAPPRSPARPRRPGRRMTSPPSRSIAASITSGLCSVTWARTAVRVA